MSAWKECPNNNSVEGRRRYSLSEENPGIVTNIGGWWCTVIGSTSLPLNQVISWNVKILRSEKNDGGGIFVGVAPFDIDQNKGEGYDCGWHLNCWNSTLWSGLPHSQRNKEYGPRKRFDGEYVHTGDSVGVVMDTTNGELSFYLDGVNLGVAYSGIPLDKPLVPCVSLRFKDDCVELSVIGMKANMNGLIPAPSILTAKRNACGSITLTWNAVEGASYYQIEVDGGNIWDVSSTNSFVKKGLLLEKEHTFRVRAVIGILVGEWSDFVKGRTQKKSFECVWKECPDDVGNDRKYSVDERNTKVATMIGDKGLCTIIGNAHLPFNKVTSWSIKILKSKENDGWGIYIGVAPSDISQNEDKNYNKCGWYFDCWQSTLHSGSPHKYRYEEYGPRKRFDGEYVHTGDSAGVVMDTAKGELSFILNGVNLGAAYEGIPLDKPLVPSVILFWVGDSVELDTSEVKETTDSSIPVPSNITTKSISWDSITLAWDAVEGASSYQIEADESKSQLFTANTFTKRGLLPETEHTFRVRAVRGNSVSEWSDAVRGKTQKAPDFSECVWKKCPDCVDKDKKYFAREENPRIAAKPGINGSSTVIGNAPLPLNKVISWDIKILEAKYFGDCIYIGVAPSDINQNKYDNDKKCGWYLNCHDLSLRSGPPHNYCHEEYGPKKRDGLYIFTDSCVCVIMDTAKGELSFAVNGVNLGVAFEGIPLDKPLVPCVLFSLPSYSFEFVFKEIKIKEDKDCIIS